MTVDSPSSFVSETLASCERLVAQGRLAEAVDLLDAADRGVWDADLERRLLALRHAAVAEVAPAAITRPFPDAVPYDGPRRNGMPAVPIEDLTPAVARSAITTHGCVLVPRAVPRDRCERLIPMIDRGFEAGAKSGDATPEPGTI